MQRYLSFNSDTSQSLYSSKSHLLVYLHSTSSREKKLHDVFEMTSFADIAYERHK